MGVVFIVNMGSNSSLSLSLERAIKQNMNSIINSSNKRKYKYDE